MPQFAANLSMLFQEHDFLDRFEAAAGAGFQAVEYLFPYDYPQAALADKLHQHGLTQALFNLPPGDWQAGERGLAAIPGREADFIAGVEQGLRYAKTLGCPRLHAMAGIQPSGTTSTADCHKVYIDNLRHAARLAASEQVRLLIEPINTRDMPGYLLNTPAQARAIIDQVADDNLKLQLDLYHCQIMCGDLATHIRDYLDITDHIQIAGVPERHEPDCGEVNYFYLFELLDRLGYAGWVGCEYRPRNNTISGLGWFEKASQGNE